MTGVEAAPVIGLYVVGIVALLRWPGRCLGLATALVAWSVLGHLAFWLVIDLTLALSICWSHWFRVNRATVRFPLFGVALIATAVVALARGDGGVLSFLVALWALTWTVRSACYRQDCSGC